MEKQKKCKFSLKIRYFVLMATVVLVWPVAAQTVDVNVNVKHTVGGISTFDREKFITMHSNHDNGDWNSDNVLSDVYSDFVISNDVYFGRNTGYLTWYMNNRIGEDSSNPGWALASGSTNSMAVVGSSARWSYENNRSWAHQYEYRAASDIICAQWHPFWPDGTLMGNTPRYVDHRWAFSQTDTTAEPFGSATGNAMGHFMNEFYGTAANSFYGAPLPKYVEVINEPEWELWGWDPPDTSTEIANAEKLWTFHNSVSDQVKAVHGDVMVGGYCTAFPDHENSDFLEWERGWKSYIDNCGTNLDFYTLHLYDFNESSPLIRRGSNLEATLDLVEHYSEIAVGEVKPFVISEYGGRNRSLESGSWSAYRDWHTIKSISSMLMSFADRPNLMEKTIPFIMLKEEWSYSGTVNSVHNWRLMRKENEPTSYTGDFVYTEMVKFYQLWSDVKGTRVDIVSSDPDTQVDAYVDGAKVYVILNNLDSTAKTVDLNLSDFYGNTVQSVREKNLYLNGSAVALDDINHSGDLTSVQLRADGTAILEYTLVDEVAVNETTDEVKYYADTYLQTITAGVENTFQINGVNKGTYGEAVLRLGMGRISSSSKQPTVLVNGTEVDVPSDFMGHEGDSRANFFGVLDIPVPYSLLQESNTVSVIYGDTGGHISSVSLRAYKFSMDVRGVDIPIDQYELVGENLVLSFTNGPPEGYFTLYSKTNLMDAAWSIKQAGLPVDSFGSGSVSIQITESKEYYRLSESEEPVLTALSSADFESGFGDWVNVSSGDDRDWTLNSGGTSSSGTGPDSGAGGSTWYVYLEASGGSAGESAILEGPELGGSNRILSFYYHMYGDGMGALNVDVLSGGSWTEGVWSISGQQHTSNEDEYTKTVIDLGAYSGDIRIRFRAVRGGGARSDIAIDNVEVASF